MTKEQKVKEIEKEMKQIGDNIRELGERQRNRIEKDKHDDKLEIREEIKVVKKNIILSKDSVKEWDDIKKGFKHEKDELERLDNKLKELQRRN